jgi:6-phosphofructokinase
VRSVKVDLDEAYRCGREAVKLASAGQTGYMVTMKRVSNDPYKITFDKIELEKVAVAAKPMPKKYFNRDGNFVSPAFIEYMKPLSGSLPDFVKLEKMFVKK